MKSNFLFATLRTGAAVAMFATCALGQVASHQSTAPQGTGSQHGSNSNRKVFAQECGLADPAPEKATPLSRNPAGKWYVLSAQSQPGPKDNAIARVWHQGVWVVDINESGDDGSWIHIGRMCFNPAGALTRMVDEYMDPQRCSGCMRYTDVHFENGKPVKREQKFFSHETRSEMPAPSVASQFPPEWSYHKVEQLPFFGLLKK